MLTVARQHANQAVFKLLAVGSAKRLCHCTLKPGTRSIKNVCRIGCSSGFWGDTSVSTQQLVKHGNIDYLVSDYLSEITMSLLAGAKMKSPKLGFAPDFINYSVGPMLKEITKQGIRVVTNAGGINAASCAEFLIAYAKNVGLDLSGSVAVVTGDDAKTLLPSASSNMINANAYLGAQPIAQALDAGAQFVITGRCVDSALVLGPLIHEEELRDFPMLGEHKTKIIRFGTSTAVTRGSIPVGLGAAASSRPSGPPSLTGARRCRLLSPFGASQPHWGSALPPPLTLRGRSQRRGAGPAAALRALSVGIRGLQSRLADRCG